MKEDISRPTPPPPGEPWAPPSAPVANASATFYTKFRSEMVAGGATEETDTASGATALVGLGGWIAALALLASLDVWYFVIALGFIVSVFLHELGHFVTARRAGMKVTQFFLGFGPKLWSFRRGEVEYGLRAIPLGAFVRIVGMNNLDTEVDPADEARTYRSKSYPWRMLVITAGSLMHMIIALVLVFAVFATKGRLEESGSVRIAFPPAAGSPAEAAGLREGDVVAAVDGQAVTSAEQLVREIQSREPGSGVDLTIVRDGQQVQLRSGLGSNPNPGSVGKAYLGINSDSLAWDRKAPLAAAGFAVTTFGDGVYQTLTHVGKVLNPVTIVQHLTGQRDDLETRPITVIGATQAGGLVGARDGLASVMLLLAGINVSVGLINMVPLLPLDGGHAAVATYERIRSGRRGRYHADVAKLMPLTFATLALLGLLFFTGVYLDVAKPLGG